MKKEEKAGDELFVKIFLIVVFAWTVWSMANGTYQGKPADCGDYSYLQGEVCQ